MLVLWGSRMWLLYWDYSSSQLQVKMIWRKHMDQEYKSWVLANTKLGRSKNVLIFCFVMLLLVNSLIGLLTHYTNFGEIVHWIALSIVTLLAITLTILCIQLHRFRNLSCLLSFLCTFNLFLCAFNLLY